MLIPVVPQKYSDMSEPDLNFDVDALFDHMIENLGHSSDDELEWLFSFEGGTAESLRSIAKSLPHEFIPDVAEELEQVDEEGNLTIGGPVLSLTTQGKFDRSEIKSLTARMKQIALDNNLLQKVPPLPRYQ